MGRRRVEGALLWIVQITAIPIELVCIALVTAPYSLIDNTLSDLGAVGCVDIPYPGRDVPVCSPAHLLFNGSLLVGSVLVGAGALLLFRFLSRPKGRRVAVVGVVVTLIAQLSAAATALVPLDVDLELHTLVSAPAFVAQPLGLLFLGIAGRLNRRWWGVVLMVVGGATLLVGAFFVVRLDPSGGGLLERLVLWPATVAFAVVGIDALRGAREHTRNRSSERRRRQGDPLARR